MPRSCRCCATAATRGSTRSASFRKTRAASSTAFLESYFPRYVEYDFTADLEGKLDEIANHELDWKKVLREFWTGFTGAVAETKDLRIKEVIDVLDALLNEHNFPPKADGSDPRACPQCGTGRLGLKVGKFGFFVGCSNYPECKYTRQVSQDTNGEDTTDGGKPLVEPKHLGKDPATGGDISIRLGPYGPYVQLDLPESAQPKIEEPVAEVVEEKPAKATKGKKKAAKPKKPKKVAAPKPKRASLPKGLTIEATTLEKALELLALPRLVGNHPETGDKIEANNGRFGPYLKYQSMFVSIPKGEDLFTIGMNRAVDLIAIKKEKIANGTLKTFGRGKPKAAKEKPAKAAAKKKAAPKKKKA
jgi:DNA topoisomerase-1